MSGPARQAAAVEARAAESGTAQKRLGPKRKTTHADTKDEDRGRCGGDGDRRDTAGRLSHIREEDTVSLSREHVGEILQLLGDLVAVVSRPDRQQT